MAVVAVGNSCGAKQPDYGELNVHGGGVVDIHYEDGASVEGLCPQPPLVLWLLSYHNLGPAFMYLNARQVSPFSLIAVGVVQGGGLPRPSSDDKFCLVHPNWN